MSNTTNNNPIRVADLSDTVYIPRTPTRKQPLANSAYAGPPTDSPAVVPESPYVWSERTVEPVNAPSLQGEVAVSPKANQSNIKSEHPTLAELRAKFIREQSLSGTPEPERTRESERTSSPTAETTASEKVEQPTNSTPILAEQSNQPSLQDNVATAKVPSHLETVPVWGIDYHPVTMAQSIDYLDKIIAKREPSFAITANLNYAMLCFKHPRLQAFTKRASLVLCDGMPIFWRSKLSKKSLPERVAGSDLIYQLSERCAAKRYRVYLYGAAEGVAEAAAAQLQKRYPLLEIAGVQCPPFHDSSSTAIQDQVARIKKARPDVLFVALGQPKGEYWIEDHLKELGVPLAIQLGASFDFVAGQAKRAPKWMQRTGLEWLYRAVQDPWRLIPRYWGNFVFLMRSVRREMIDGLS
jgi:N-acetylglucosaminyldiphosphoundecaprenol N-acetyl-beta-D-mannosaminyltransferase